MGSDGNLGIWVETEQEYWESLCISIGACVYLLSSTLQGVVV